MYTDAIFMQVKMIQYSDGTFTIIDDANKMYVPHTNSEESGTSFTMDTSSGMIPTKNDVTTADLVELPDGSRKYRFIITADNIDTSENPSLTNDMWVYADADTKSLTNIYTITNNAPMTANINISSEIDDSVFEIPSDYTEVTYAEYQEKLMEAYAGLFGNDEDTDNTVTE